MSVPLPTRDGVSPSSVWLPEGSWGTVLEFLTHRFTEIDATAWTSRMIRGDVVDEEGRRLSPDCAYRGGVRLYYYRELETEARIPFDEIILYHDEHLLVVDKPHFLLMVPAGRFLQETLLVRLRKKLQLDFLAPIHRLDRETAGVVLFSVQPASRGAYHALFQRREIVKVYEAIAGTSSALSFPLTYRSRLVRGHPFFMMKEVEGVPNSETHVDVLETYGDTALYGLMPITGRKHQLRAHMASLGIPIINDSFYSRSPVPVGNDYSRPLQLLARSIAFVDPLTGTRRCFESRRKLAGVDPVPLTAL